jgi:cyanophycinase
MASRILPVLLVAALALVGCGAPLPARAAQAALAQRPGVRAVAAGPLLLVGGGADQDDVMKAFGRLAGGPAASIVIMPLASSDPAKSGKAYVDYLAGLGFPKAIAMIPKGEPDDADRARLREAGGFFFSGGDQARILGALTPAWRGLLGDAWRRGAALAGTSAGAMVWGGTAILGGEPMATGWYGEDPAQAGIRLGTGLGLWPRLVADTHFAERGRLPRLAYALAKQGGGVGVGVDPQTGALLHPDGKLEVLGRGTVTIVRTGAQAPKAPLSVRDLRVDILSAGDATDVGPLAREAP